MSKLIIALSLLFGCATAKHRHPSLGPHCSRYSSTPTASLNLWRASGGSRRRLPLAQVYSTDGADITVSTPGKALIIVGDPTGPDITFKCYGAEVTASVGDSKYCGEL